MILTTTPTVEWKRITNYHGIVFGEVISGVNLFKDFFASIRDMIWGRSGSYEEELTKRAMEKGANAVVGIDIDYEVLGQKNSMLMVTASGTAVTLS